MTTAQEKHKLVSEELRQLGFFAVWEKQAKKAQLKQLNKEIVQLNSELKKAADEALISAKTEMQNAKDALNPTRMRIKYQLLTTLAEIGIPSTLTEIMHASPTDLGLLSNQQCTSCIRELVNEGRVKQSSEKRKTYFQLVRD